MSARDQGEGQGRDRGVAGAGDVEDFARGRPHMPVRELLPHPQPERHAFLAARHQGAHRAGDLRDAMDRPLRVLVGANDHAADLLGFLLIWRDQPGALEETDVAHLWIHEDVCAPLPRQFDHRAHEGTRDHALLVIGDDEGRARGQHLRDLGQELHLDRRVDRLRHLAVGAHHLLLMGHDARLHRGGASGQGHQPGIDAAIAGGSGQMQAGRIVTHHPDEGRLPAEGLHVERDVGSSPEPLRLAGHPHHRHRRLGRDARHLAEDEHVEHHVADHDHPAALERTKDRLDPGRFEERLHCSRTTSEPPSASRSFAAARDSRNSGSFS